jgi:hypothetical protein
VNVKETVQLIAVIKALCPSQKFEEITHRAWQMVMSDIPYKDAQAAVRTIYRDQGDDAQWNRTIEADDIIRQVKRDRTRRTETGASCHICRKSETGCRKAQENALRIANEVHARHPDRQWDMELVDSTRHEFTLAPEAPAIATTRRLTAPPATHADRTPWLPENLLDAKNLRNTEAG